VKEYKMQLLKDKKALITGGTSGIGRATALLFAAQGASVVIFGTSVEKGAEVLSELCTISSAKMQFIPVDVSNYEAASAAVEAATQFLGGVDILVNNAGITKDQLLMKMSEEDWDRVLDVNLKSVFIFSKAVIRPMMKARYGKIINVSSVIALTGNPGQVNYSASKSGMIGLTQSLAKEVAGRGINVNCIAPGFIETPMTRTLTPEQKEAILSQIPMKRLGDPTDVANLCLFLASPLSNYVTGEVIAVDGGMTA
jgi:3-oxoacyl-[acyl-carrier protein] reductase